MTTSWCTTCHADVSLAHAIAELPCPDCGEVSYFAAISDGRRDDLISEAERYMRLGQWDAAKDKYRQCRELDLITETERIRLTVNLELRRNAYE